MSFGQRAVGPEKRESRGQVAFALSFAYWAGFMLQGPGGVTGAQRGGSSLYKGPELRRSSVRAGQW